jgi:hypothetical protein
MKPFLESARCGEARDELATVRSMRLCLVLGDGVSRVRMRGFGGGDVSSLVPRNRERSLHTCAQDVQITRMATI